MFEANTQLKLEEVFEHKNNEMLINFIQSVRLTKDYWDSSLTFGNSDEMDSKSFISDKLKKYTPKIFIHPSARKVNSDSSYIATEKKQNQSEHSLTKVFGDWSIDKGDYHYKEDPKLFKVFNSTDWYDIKQELIKTGWYFVFATTAVILICYLVASHVPVN